MKVWLSMVLWAKANKQTSLVEENLSDDGRALMAPHKMYLIRERLGHGIEIGEKYMNYNSNHNHNERSFVIIPNGSIRAQVDESTVRYRKNKWI